jgi:hypothetical protein
MPSRSDYYWIVAAAVSLMVSGTLVSYVEQHSPAAAIRVAALEEIVKRTHIGSSFWSFDYCKFDGEIWHAKAVASPFGGRVVVQLSADGTVLRFSVIRPPVD